MLTSKFWRGATSCMAAVVALLTAVSATENGGSVYPAGVETVMTGMQPLPVKR